MATNQDPEEFIEEDEQDEIARRSIFSAGWFRALLVLTVLAIVVVVSLPYLLNWLEPTPAPPTRPQAKVSEPAPAPAPAPTPAPPPPAETKPPAMVPAPPAPAPAAKTETPAPAPAAPPAKTDASKTAQAPAPSPADRPVGTAPLPAAPAPAAPAAKAAPEAKAETPKPAATKRSAAPATSGQGGFWVQVGAFAEEHNAEALSRKLRGENFPVTVSRITRGGGSAPAPAPAPAAPAPATGSAQNQLFITGSTLDAVNAALKGKGTGQPVKGGIVVNPAYDLETAMSLSSALKKEGFKVVIRRAGPAPASAPKASASKSSGDTGGTTFHVVRVGGYPDRAKAQQVRAELEAKGIPGFLAQGAAR